VKTDDDSLSRTQEILVGGERERKREKKRGKKVRKYSVE
jgi:hypothetical protein